MQAEAQRQREKPGVPEQGGAAPKAAPPR
jgi:hypothetical protein